jgi:hypothetical protein
MRSFPSRFADRKSKMVFAALLLVGAVELKSADPPHLVAERAFDLMAGAAWEKARYFAFTFNVEREGKIAASFPQRLDRFSGDYRVSGNDRQGPFLVIMNVNSRSGRAWRDGVELSDPKELLELGYRRFINDTYWLLMPLKMRDPGVKLEAAGSRVECNRTYDVVKLSFETGVGLTPGDQYWAWVNRDSGLVDFWEMVLQNAKDPNPRRVIFHGYRRFGDLLLSTLREYADGSAKIRLDDIEVRSEVPAAAFEP